MDLNLVVLSKRGDGLEVESGMVEETLQHFCRENFTRKEVVRTK